MDHNTNATVLQEESFLRTIRPNTKTALTFNVQSKAFASTPVESACWCHGVSAHASHASRRTFACCLRAFASFLHLRATPPSHFSLLLSHARCSNTNQARMDLPTGGTPSPFDVVALRQLRMPPRQLLESQLLIHPPFPSFPFHSTAFVSFLYLSLEPFSAVALPSFRFFFFFFLLSFVLSFFRSAR